MESRSFHLIRACRITPTGLFSTSRYYAPSILRGQTTARRLATTSAVESTLASESAASPPPPSSSSPLSEPSSRLSSSAVATPTPTATIQNPPAPHTIKLQKGTVISAGRMDRTVRVQYNHFMFHKRLNKTFPDKTVYMVSDPNNSLCEGDVIEFSNGWRKSRNVRHVVERIVAPFGSRVEDRPPILSREERERMRIEKREKKLARKGESGKGVSREPYVGKIKKMVQERMAQMSEEEKERLREI